MNTKLVNDKNDPPDQFSEIQTKPQEPSKAPQCEECDQELAKLHCVECEQYLCKTCDQQIHNKGARKNHQRSPLPNTFEDSAEPKESIKESFTAAAEGKFQTSTISPAPIHKPPSMPQMTSSSSNSRFSSVSTDSSSLPYLNAYPSFVPKGGFTSFPPRIFNPFNTY